MRFSMQYVICKRVGAYCLKQHLLTGIGQRQVDEQMVGAGFNQKSMRKYRNYDHMLQTHAHIPQLLIIYI